MTRRLPWWRAARFILVASIALWTAVIILVDIALRAVVP